MKLRHLDLFSGIGGFALGLGMTGGFETVAFCESDEPARRVLRRHWPDVPIFEDVRILDARSVGPVDIVTGGFPCQPFSLAGQRRGTDDDRHLWPAMLRVIAACRPAWVIGENVAGLVSMVERRDAAVMESRTGGRTADGADYEAVAVRTEHMLLDRICSDLGGLGYAVQPFVVPACAVGAPHRRDRIWIVAHDDRACGHRAADGEVRAGRNAAEPCVVAVADAGGGRCGGPGQRQDEQPGRAEIERSGEDVADAHREREQQPGGPEREERGRAGDGRADAANAESIGRGARRPGRPAGDRARQAEQAHRDGADADDAGLAVGQGLGGDDGEECAAAERACRWEPEPGVGQCSDGVSTRLDGGRIDGKASHSCADTAMQALLSSVGAEAVERAAGGPDCLHEPRLLQPSMHGGCLCQRCAIEQGYVSLARSPDAGRLLRIVWGYDQSARPPHRREAREQLAREHPDLMRGLSCLAPPPCSTCWQTGSWEDGIPRVATGVPNRVDRLRQLGNAVVPAVVAEFGRAILMEMF